MRVRDDNLLAVAAALRDSATALAAIRELTGRPERIAIEGLLEVVIAAPSVRLTQAALAALEPSDYPLVRDAARATLASRFAPVRQAAVQLIHRRGWNDFDDELRDVLRSDSSWPTRRAAVQAIADRPDPVRWNVLIAADDPHWRVRHALVRVLLGWGTNEVDRAMVRNHLVKQCGEARSRGVAAYLEWTWSGSEPPSWKAFNAPDPAARCPFWDWDPAVLAVKLAQLGSAGRAAAIDAMPFLIGHDEERVWRLAVDAIRDIGEAMHFAESLGWLDDPRTGAAVAVGRLFDGLDGDRLAETARYIERAADATPAQRQWAATRIVVSTSRSLPVPGPDHPFARAEALTPERAAELVTDPERETSWHVLERACRLAKVPIWEIEPAHAWKPRERPTVPAEPIEAAPTLAAHRTQLGPEVAVSRVGVSGHYGLPVEGFARAAEAGVNWFFWEPNYDTLTAFAGRLSAGSRRGFHFVAGTFEAEPKRIVRDAERALRMLKVERLGLFLIFWVQSWDRLTDDVRSAVAQLKADGKAATVGLSSHDRPLLVRAMEEGWNPIMARHSAAHRGAERIVFPKAVERGTTVLTFNNLCYGRMLRPVAGLPPPDPADCYRYSLNQPGVAACWSAPATLDQLDANLRALADPTLSDERREELVRFGAALYREETVFRRLIREL